MPEIESFTATRIQQMFEDKDEEYSVTYALIGSVGTGLPSAVKYLSTVAGVAANQDSGPALNAFLATFPAGGTIVNDLLIETSVPIVLPAKVRYEQTGSANSGTTGFKQLSGSAIAGAIVCTKNWYNNVASGDDSVAIEEMFIDGNKANCPSSTAHGLVLMAFWSRIDRVVVRNTVGDGVRLTDVTRSGTNLSAGLTGSETVFGEIVARHCDGDGFRVLNQATNSCLDGTLDLAYIEGCGRGVVIDRSAGWTIDSIHSYGIATDAVILDQMFATRLGDVYVEDFGLTAAASAQYTGLKLGVLAGRPSQVRSVQVTCNDTSTAPNYFDYIRVTGNSGQVDALITLTSVTLTGQSGIRGRGLVVTNASGGNVIVEKSGVTIRTINAPQVIDGTGNIVRAVDEVEAVAGRVTTLEGDVVTIRKVADLFNTGMIPALTGTGLLPHDNGSGVATQRSDDGMTVIRCLGSAVAGTGIVTVDVNAFVQQSVPGEVAMPSPIQVERSILSPWGQPLGAYSSGTSYAVDAVVSYQSKWWRSRAASNSNHTPGATGMSVWWEQCVNYRVRWGGKTSVIVPPGGRVISDEVGVSFAAHDYVGVVTRVTPCRLDGTPVTSLTIAAYDAGVTYTTGTVVSSGARLYESLQAGNLANTPTTAGTAFWGVVGYPYASTAYTNGTSWPTGTNPDVAFVSAAGAGAAPDYLTVPFTASTGMSASVAAYGSALILARPVAGVRPMVLVLEGDSIANGAADGVVLGNEKGGYLARAFVDPSGIGFVVPVLRASKAGDSYRYWLDTEGRRIAGRDLTYAVERGATHWLGEMGTNDIGASTLAEMQARYLARWRDVTAAGLVTIQAVPTNQTTSTDSFATIVNQTPKASFGPASVWSGVRDWLNDGAPIATAAGAAIAVGATGVRAGQAGHPLVLVFDPTLGAQDANGYWLPGPMTTDGTHPIAAGAAAMAAVVPVSTILALPPVAI